MPSCAQHMGKVRSNLQFVGLLLAPGTRFLDWAITGYFYSAVHLTAAYFDRFGERHYGDHRSRRAAIVSDANISSLFNSYRKLETCSCTARYGTKQLDLTYIRERVEPQFVRIRGGIEPLHADLRI